MEKHPYSNSCPKCGRTGTRTIAKYAADSGSSQCSVDDCSDSEHLHVACPCGYKYAMDTADATPDSDTDFPDVIGPEETSSGASLYR